MSQENSEFTDQLNALRINLTTQNSHIVQIVYAGLQDENYGTCSDMSLIMLQELLESSISNHPIYSNYLYQAQYDNTSCYDNGYDNLQHIEIIGNIDSFN